MTKSEWLKRCAARFMEKAPWLTDTDDQAEMCFDAYMGEFDALAEYSPEDAADEEMSNWD